MAAMQGLAIARRMNASPSDIASQGGVTATRGGGGLEFQEAHCVHGVAPNVDERCPRRLENLPGVFFMTFRA